MDDKIVQIIPAPTNLFVAYKDDEACHPDSRIESKVLCLALTSDGDILLMDMCSDGDIHDAKTARNFKEAYFGEIDEGNKPFRG